MELIYRQECFDITGAVMELHSNLGTGFLEEVYQEALEIEFKKRGITYEREKTLHIYYKGEELKVGSINCSSQIILDF